MSEIIVNVLGGSTTRVFDDDIAALKGVIRGSVCVPGDEGYDAARTLWNAMIDRRPAMAVRCAGSADVQHAVRFARSRNLQIAVRSGGHNIAGNAVCDGGFLIDLSGMRSIHVDPAARTARAEPGATLGDVDRETQAHALALPVGINSTTGLAGLTLGGGFGWLTRKHGLTIDNLMSADVITADGERVRASNGENADLFWALRGGGGNFGIVTSFEFRLHPVGPKVLSGLIVHPLDDATALLKAYPKIAAAAPDELAIWVVMRKAPPCPSCPKRGTGAKSWCSPHATAATWPRAKRPSPTFVRSVIRSPTSSAPIPLSDGRAPSIPY